MTARDVRFAVATFGVKVNRRLYRSPEGDRGGVPGARAPTTAELLDAVEALARRQVDFDGDDAITLWKSENSEFVKSRMIQNINEIGQRTHKYGVGTMCKRVAIGSAPGGAWRTDAWQCEPDAVTECNK